MSDYPDRYLVTLRDIETGREQVLTASWSHPFFARMPENTPVAVGAEGLVYQGAIEWAAWVDAKDLQPGFQLLNPDDTWAEVIEVRREATPLTAYNLTVDEFSTFFVAANVDEEPVWVHNTSGCGVVAPRGGAQVTPDNFFDGTKYSPKVRTQVESGDYHGFPDSVDAFSGNGTITKITGRDGVTREKLEIP